jgi:hypothetical protein
MSYSAPLELLTDASGSVTFGWMEEGVYYARFSHCLSARLGEAFAARLRSAVQGSAPIKYYGDGRALESYDLLARRHRLRNEPVRERAACALQAWCKNGLSRTQPLALASLTIRVLSATARRD